MSILDIDVALDFNIPNFLKYDTFFFELDMGVTKYHHRVFVLL